MEPMGNGPYPDGPLKIYSCYGVGHRQTIIRMVLWDRTRVLFRVPSRSRDSTGVSFWGVNDFDTAMGVYDAQLYSGALRYHYL